MNLAIESSNQYKPFQTECQVRIASAIPCNLLHFCKLLSVLVYQEILSFQSVDHYHLYHVRLVYHTPLHLNYLLPWQRKVTNLVDFTFSSPNTSYFSRMHNSSHTQSRFIDLLYTFLSLPQLSLTTPMDSRCW